MVVKRITNNETQDYMQIINAKRKRALQAGSKEKIRKVDLKARNNKAANLNRNQLFQAKHMQNNCFLERNKSMARAIKSR
jgi:hypothetical protein